jgi:hypothetical protein
MAMMGREMQGNMKLHGIGRKYAVGEETTRQAVRALVNHPGAGYVHNM